MLSETTQQKYFKEQNGIPAFMIPSLLITLIIGCHFLCSDGPFLPLTCKPHWDQWRFSWVKGPLC